ncbi:MAG: GNAT family N-acetyltransferase [Chloroflexota bacterium]|nr:GNAT family N-acetyltransferase [Chloroflexota bacterium]
MSVRVRPFADRDHNAFARVRSTGEGEPTTPEQSRERDALWDRSRYERVRVVAVDEEDAPLGYGEIYQEPTRFDPRRYYVRLAVDLRMRRRGTGDALWRQLRAELGERGALGAYAWARDATAGASFLTKRGFREVVRWYTQVRAVMTAPLPTPALDERLSRAGIRVATLAEVARAEPTALEHAHAVYFASRLDQATLGRVTPTPFADWKRAQFDGDGTTMEGYFVAIADGHIVGQTTARRSRAEDVLDIGVTGVLPSFRRRGIARALKLRLHAYARANGYRELHTRTARENPAMVALNDALGYVIIESIAGYELAIPSSP